jgi:diguanylate cyclase (GGDEF)-like protein/PAS domain S-box-containing protein
LNAIVLTLCFGFNAVLLSGRAPLLSAATITMSVGAVAWGAVWICATALEKLAPGTAVSPEIWNLPKYFLAAGMVLDLLEEEIRSAALASEQYRLLFAGNPHAMWIYDPESLAFLDVNDAAVAQYGYTRQEFRLMALPDIVDLGDDEFVAEQLRANESQTLTGPWLHRRKDGTEFQVDIASQPMLREGSRATFALMHDVTEPRRLHAQLIRQAHHDVLTDLPNRALFEQRLEVTLEEARRKRHKAAVFCIDLDRFKQINDTYGHAAGDKCLREMARRITARLGGVGTLARTGGDEFMLTVGELQEANEAEELADLLLDDLKESVTLERGEVELVASIGIAVYPDDGLEVAQLWRDADVAMYRAKRAGGSHWVRVSREISDSATEANDIELGLRRALKASDLEVFYQPQMTADGDLHCLEALFRSTDPLLSRVPTNKIIAIAEESGLIVPLGDWVLEETCRQTREWMDEGLAPVQVAVNVSPLQLTRFDFSRKVGALLERFELSPRMLEFEVTESTMMPDRGDAPHQIAMLARMGIRFAVDDFGTGYSSLGRLHQLPVDSLKIDSSFTQHIGERKGTYPTVRAIIALAHTFGMKVVAEGVETDEQWRMLRQLNCDRMQGYLFSKPLPATQVRSYLEQAADTAMTEVVA